jgi:hypothetical protein
MREKLWAWLAMFIVKHPFIIEWIIKNAEKKPYFHLPGYQNRWWLTPRFLLTRDEKGHLVPHRFCPEILQIRVHQYLRADIDRHKHDHPADNRSIVMLGYLDEMDVFGRSNMRWAGQTVYRRAECFHKIAHVSSNCWTLWMRGKTINEWGFLVDGRKIIAKTYFEMQARGEV